jgi:uncharacterized membrane protein YfhO
VRGPTSGAERRRAWVDGAETEILRANYAFRAVAMPAGTHLVKMSFEPALWRWGLVLAGLTATVESLFGLWPLRRGTGHKSA